LDILRLRPADLHSSKWRRPGLAILALPEAVNLNLLATDLRVLLLAIGLGMTEKLGNHSSTATVQCKMKIQGAQWYGEFAR